MNLYEIIRKWKKVSPDLKLEMLERLVEHLQRHEDDIDIIDSELLEFFESLIDYEADDFFGSEGLKI